ncbi:hypothetical protein HWV62_33307 [Athelia sp. TMB]|nr:hypothetical protein HWV62_33307 [Athelia sp. TMB]
MDTRNRGSRRGVVASKAGAKKATKSAKSKAKDVAPLYASSFCAWCASDGTCSSRTEAGRLESEPVNNSNIVAISSKCSLDDQESADLDEQADAICAPSPTKTRVKPSNRAGRTVEAPVAAIREQAVPVQVKKKSLIVFTDDEDTADQDEAAALHVGDLQEVDRATDDEEEDVLSVEGERQSDVDFIDDSAVVDDGEDSNSEVDCEDNAGENLRRSHLVHSAAQHASDAAARPKTPVNKEVDRMHTEERMFNAARQRSIASIASTNPGDGTMRLYGEQSYIHDDILDSPTINRQHARAPVTPVKPAVQRQRVRVPDSPIKGYKAPEKPQYADEDMKYLSDLDPRGQQGPEVCQIANGDDMDPIITYSNLPKLLSGKRLESWSSVPGPGLAVPSAWHEQIPGMSMSQLRNVIQFRNQAHMYNPSRMTPSEMGLAPHPGNSYIVPAGSTRAATLTTAILVTSSNLYRMKEVFGEDRRMISGIPHISEWQRMESAILMAFHLQSAHAQIAQQAITFSTSRTMSNVSTSPAKNPSRMFHQPAGASASGGSPFSVAQSNIQGSGYVPILDGRHTRFSMQENLTSLDRILPPFNAEVPEGSCAWVGYTVNKYTTTKGTNLNFNLLWVVVLGTAE